ncbi:MAG: helix-turn-helix transcriptional regulator, partial [Planctomycetota bacterium]|nr:helix-turn-helix transcriptional regulator [Planctomycetota bacterium]
FRDGEPALAQTLRGKRLAHGPAQSIQRAAETVAKIQNAIVALRARQLAPRERKLGPLAFEDEVRARARAAEAVRTGARGWKTPVEAWCELVLVRHYRQLNTVRRKYAEFLALLTRDLDGGFGLDYPVARALRALYATFALQDLAAGFPALLAPLVPLLARRGPGALEAGTRSEPVARALAYLQAHATEPIGLAETAAAVHFSAPHLSRRFHRETGRTLTEHLQGLRVAHAQRLLAESGEGVLAVALRSGFPTLEHFYRVFKKRTGMTPRAWRLARHA